MQSKLFEKRKWRLIGDNVFIGLLGTCGAWCFSFKAACSYGLGAVLGTFYLVLLARFVENLGKEGGGGGSARLILAVLLVLLSTKNKDTLDLIPAVIGFLTYQASLKSLRQPISAALEIVKSFENHTLRIHDPQGRTGCFEAPPSLTTGYHNEALVLDRCEVTSRTEDAISLRSCLCEHRKLPPLLNPRDTWFAWLHAPAWQVSALVQAVYTDFDSVEDIQQAA